MEHEANEMTKMPSTRITTETEGAVPHLVLIHGACHGAWCWYKLRCAMESVGYRVTCLDLAASGIEASDADSISTFDDYNKPLLHFMASLSDHQKVILVGHSAGGHSLTQIIHKYPHKIHAAVFVAATMLPFGFLTPQDIKDGSPEFSGYEDVYIYGHGSGSGGDQSPTSVLFKTEYLRELLYNMSPLEDLALSRMLLRPCPFRAFKTAKFASEGGDGAWERVPRVYIKTLHDHTLKPEQQEAMIKKWAPSQVYEIDSDHSPFFSNPSALFGLLLNVAMSYTT